MLISLILGGAIVAAQVFALGVLFLQFLPGKDLSFKALSFIRILATLYVACTVALVACGCTTVAIVMTAAASLVALTMVVVSWRHPLPIRAMLKANAKPPSDHSLDADTRQDL